MSRIDELLDQPTQTELPPKPSTRTRLRVPALAAIAAVVLVVNAAIAMGGGGLNGSVSVDDAVAPTGDPVALLDIEVIGVDVARGVQQLLVLPIPQTESGLFGVETRLVVERNGLPPTIVTFAPGATIFPAQVEVAAVGGRNDYPWDSYQSQLRLSLEEAASGVSLPVEAEVDTSLSGWRIEAALSNTGTDTITMSTTAERALGPVLVAALQFVAILAVGLLLAAVTFDNVQKRHAAFGSTFAALNALVFLTVIRRLMPNSPPLGIRLDFAFTYPALLLASTAMLTLVVLFLSRWLPARLRGEVPGGSMTFG